MSKIIDRALELRVTGKRRSPDPSRAYQNRLEAPRQVLETIETSSLPARVKLEARRLFVVCICAAFESFWRDVVRSMVAELGVSVTLRRNLRKQTFSLGDLGDILGRELTLAELVSCSYTFQHPEIVNRSMSDILSIDVFCEFKQSHFALVEVPRKNRKPETPLARVELTGEFALKRIPLIERCFTIRHETVHHVGHVYRPTYRNVLEMENAVWIFNEFLSMFVGGRVDKAARKQSNSSLQRTHRKAHR